MSTRDKPGGLLGIDPDAIALALRSLSSADENPPMPNPNNLQMYLLAELQANLQNLQPEVVRLSQQIIRHEEVLRSLQDDLRRTHEGMNHISREIGQILGRMDTPQTGGLQIHAGRDVGVGRDLQAAEGRGRNYGEHPSRQEPQRWQGPDYRGGEFQDQPRYPDRPRWSQDRQQPGPTEEREPYPAPYPPYYRGR